MNIKITDLAKEQLMPILTDKANENKFLRMFLDGMG